MLCLAVFALCYNVLSSHILTAKNLLFVNKSTLSVNQMHDKRHITRVLYVTRIHCIAFRTYTSQPYPTC